MKEPADAGVRRRLLTEYGTTFFVEAAAGTGKTTVLVGRIVGLIRSGAGTLGKIVAVTFTEPAAGEMKLRLRTEIEKARLVAADEERERLDRALEELELARIGTIHSFCGDLLRERPIESGIDPLFEVASEHAAEDIADAAFTTWFQKILSDPPEGVRRVLRRRSGNDTPRGQLRDGLNTLREHRDFPAPWRRDPFDRDGAIDALMIEFASVGSFAAKGSRPDDYLVRNLEEISRFVEETTRIEAVRGRDYDGLEAELRAASRWKSWNHKGFQKTTFGTRSRTEVLALRDRVKADLDAFVHASDADLAPLLHAALQEPIAGYEVLKARAGKLDFLDLLVKARDLIRTDPAVRGELQRRFSHFFVDEFQDTDPLQAEMLFLLAADDPAQTDWRTARPIPGKLFLVGDPKQSIYGFRRADVALYEDVKQRLLRAGAELLHLTTSFRARPSIQSFINTAFGKAMAGDADSSQAAYVALQPSRSEIDSQPTIVALPVPKPYGDYGKITNWKIEESFPEAVGAFIAWLINDSGWTVEKEGRAIPIRPHHVAILSRRLRSFGNDVTRPYVRALEARRIQHVLVGGRSFHDREEVIALRNAVTAIEWPDDELRVFATLRGPFFAFSDEALLSFRHQVGGDGSVKIRRLDPARPPDRVALDPAAAEVADALELLRDLHIRRNHRPIAETVALLLERVRAHAGIALWPNGEQALANCQRLIDMARQFERSASSFRAFVEKLESDAEGGETDEAPIVEQGTEGVRVMTVHKSKGLEFPVVVLADPTCNETRAAPSRHVEPHRRLWTEPLCNSAPVELLEAAEEETRRDREEAVRVTYVAATRARDLLVAPVCGDGPLEGWLDALRSVLYPPSAAWHKSANAIGCPPFGEDSVADRGPKAVPPPGGPVRPGLHRPVPDGAAVVWWDPTRLALEADEHTALRLGRILEKDTEGAATASEQHYLAWKERRAALLGQASRPSVAVRTVTAFARTAAAAYGAPVRVETIAHGDRPSGRRFGALVHATLAAIDLDARADAIQALAETNGRLVGASDEEVKAAVVVVATALGHPILQRAAVSARTGGLRRETPVLLRLDDGSLIEGVADLAFKEDTLDFAGWTVVDFKTDREFATLVDRYRAQVNAYSQAIAAATGLPSRGILMVV